MNVRTRSQVEEIVRQAGQELGLFCGYKLGQYGGALAAQTPAYLANGISSTVTLIAGGTNYTSSVFTVPLPATAPANSVPAVVTFVNSSGVLSSPTITEQGSGYGTSGMTFVPPDATGTGASVTLLPANPDQVYNYTPQQVQFIQRFLAVDYANVSAVLNGTQGSTTATGVAVGSTGGTGYTVGDTPQVTQAGTQGLLVTVTSVGAGGVVTGVAVLNGGIGTLVGSNLPTTDGGTGLTVNITSVGQYNFLANTLAWTLWGF